MLLKSIFVITFFCLMEWSSVKCSGSPLLRKAPVTDTTIPDEEITAVNIAVYPSPLQFAN
ncbi:MAG: hypothetical protein ABWZ25_02565 [Chitinophagaceae bacterium]